MHLWLDGSLRIVPVVREASSYSPLSGLLNRLSATRFVQIEIMQLRYTCRRLMCCRFFRPPRSARSRSERGSGGVSRLVACGIGLIALLFVACGQPAIRLPLKPFYVPADRAAGSVHLNVGYREDPSADASKHRLDLYLPPGEGWPMLVFVHGGSLEKGDTSQRTFGHDIYRNIGRFYSSQGVAVALVNYRLQPDVTWLEQVDDVAAAVSWVGNQLDNMGGGGRLYLSGHSAGSWLVARVALDAELRSRYELDEVRIDGVISVSGSGFDLTDQKTWDMFGRGRALAPKVFCTGCGSGLEATGVRRAAHRGGGAAVSTSAFAPRAPCACSPEPSLLRGLGRCQGAL